jgi:hypothetical protein
MIHILGLLARAGSGKTTVANYLRDNYDARIVSLASPLKQIAKVVMDFSDEQLYGTQAQKEAIDSRYGFSAREFLRKLGTEGIRENLGADVWIDVLLDRATNAASEDPTHSVFIVDDMRFVNEVNRIRSARSRELPNGSLVDIKAAVIKIVCTDAPTPPGDHASEREIDLIPETSLDAVVTSSRALGVHHLTGEVEKAISGTRALRHLKAALSDQAAALRPSFPGRRGFERVFSYPPALSGPSDSP